MKLLYCCHADNYHIEKWIPAMETAGIEVHVITFRPSNKLACPQIQVYPIFGSRITWFDFWSLAPKIRQIFYDGKFDILLCSFASTYGLAGRMSKVRPLVIQTWSRDINASHSTNFKDNLISNLISKPICIQSDGITTDGPHFRAHVLQNWKFKSNSSVLSTWWGIDVSFWNLDLAEKLSIKEKLGLTRFKKVIISPRGVYWYYRPADILKSILTLANQWQENAFIIPTLNHERSSEIERLLQILSGKANVMIIDRLMDKIEFREWLASSDYLISTPIFDGISEVIQEGMALGVIPILNPIEANRVLSQQGVNCIFTKSSQPTSNELTQLVNSILEEKNLAIDKMRQSNRYFIEQQCNVNKTVSELNNFLTNIILNK